MSWEGQCFRDELTELIELARGGDSEALEILLRSSRAALRERTERQLPREVQPRVDPSDVIQEVLLEATSDFRSFRGRSGGEWQTWLQRILAHNVIEMLRRHIYAEKRSLRSEQSPRDESWPARQVPANDLSPSQAVARQELVDWLRIFQSHLNPDFQTILKLRYWEDRTLQEIASHMDLSKSSAARLLRKALLTLRQLVISHIGTDESF